MPNITDSKDRNRGHEYAAAQAKAGELNRPASPSPDAWSESVKKTGNDSNSWDSEWAFPRPLWTESELLKKRVEKALLGWPWTGAPPKLLTVAPYLVNEHPTHPTAFTLPEAKQDSKLLSMLERNVLVLDLFTEYLFEYHDSAWKFASTCREAWRLLVWNMNFWDATRGWTNNCEYPQTKAPEVTDVSAGPRGSVSSIVLVTPVRGESHQISYLNQVQNLHKICISMNNWADYFRNIQFHRIPFLTVELLSLLIPQMKNLQVLGIYQCPLIHIGETMKLLKVIKTDKPLEKENQICLDFYPNYHEGPDCKPGDQYRVGTYGATWDNWNGDTCVAIWSIVHRVLPQARKQGVDLVSTHSAFRQWLEKSPCRNVGETIEAFMNPDIPRARVAALVDYRNCEGNPRMLQNRANQADKTWGWATQTIKCRDCKTPQMGIFYHTKNLWNCAVGFSTGAPCYGCLLTDHLRGETDHYKRQKRALMFSWLKEAEGWNNTNIPKALHDYHIRNIELQAQQLDDLRKLDMTTGRDPYDRELNERQVPYTRKELNSKRGMFLRSPTVVMTLPGDGDWFRADRYLGTPQHY